MDPVTATATAGGPAAAALAEAASATATAAAAGPARAADPYAALEVAYPFAVAFALGALIGIERERTRIRGHEPPASMPGGIRTFPLASLLGCTIAWLAAHVAGGSGEAAIIAVGVASFAALVVAVYSITSLAGDASVTTEVALFLTFVLGVVAYVDRGLLAPGLAVAATVTLALREQLRGFAGRLEQEDLFAALKLGVVTMIILPILPDRGMGPYLVWNPFKIWLLVVFISAIGFAGYVGIKVLGPGRGIALAGLLGGLVSSTAATLTFAGRSKETPAFSSSCALAIALAWCTMYARLFASVAVVAPGLVPLIAPPLAAAGVAGLAGAGVLYLRGRSEAGQETTEAAYKNPFRLMSAIQFGGFFALVLLVAKAAQELFSTAGLFLAAGLTGLFDVDAISLSAARLSAEKLLAPGTAAVAIFIAVAANTLLKAGMAFSLGAPALRRALAAVAAASLAAGAAAIFFVVPR
jgi:uncharacterized membrane protein (DUF4010 family)